MEISNISYRKLLGYFSPKTLNHFRSVLSSNTLRSQFSSSCNFCTHNLHKRPYLPISSFGSPSNCNLDSCQLQKKQSLCNSSYGSSSYSLKTSSLLPSSHSKQYLCNSSFGSSSNWLLKHPSLTTSGALNMYRCNSSYRCLVYSNVDFSNARVGSLFRFFSASSRGMTFDEDNKQEGVNPSKVDAFLGGSVAEKPPLRVSCGEFKSSFTSRGVPKEKGVAFKRTSEVIGIIRSNDDDMECKLSSIAPVLSLRSTTEVFEALNCHKVSGLRFFRWVQCGNHELRKSAGFNSLIINNCGWINDYKTMENLLREFRNGRICLTQKAFEFLPLFGSSKESVEESVKRVVDLLNEVGGSCRNSGVHELIQMLSGLGLFDMAKFVINITEKTATCYNILIREKCRRGDIEEPHDIIKEMREFGCNPDANTYNYILGSLCKSNRMSEACSILEEMKEKGTSPDAISYEIFIYSFCGLGNLERAYQFLNQMVSEGVRPRFTTHAAIIKSLINAERYEEAYKYVTNSSLKDPMSSNRSYDLLADLHQKNDVVSALKIILEMMDKGLKPNHRLYFKVSSRLRNSGKGSLADDLKNRYNKFQSVYNTPTG